jgi:hypothetical protein
LFSDQPESCVYMQGRSEQIRTGGLGGRVADSKPRDTFSSSRTGVSLLSQPGVCSRSAEGGAEVRREELGRAGHIRAILLFPLFCPSLPQM